MEKNSKNKLKDLEELFNDQLNNFKKWGCSSGPIEEFQSMRAPVLAMCCSLPENCDIPFLPVLPKFYLNICKKMFLNKEGIMLNIKQSDYEDCKFSDSFYYLIGIKFPSRNQTTSSKLEGVNVNEIISLSLLSELPGPFYAHRSRYIINSKDGTEKTITSDQAGVWLSKETGAIGPFLKDYHPVAMPLQIYGRFQKGF